MTALSIRLTLPPYNYVIYEFEVKLCPSYPHIPKATFTSQAVAILLGRSIIKVNVFFGHDQRFSYVFVMLIMFHLDPPKITVYTDLKIRHS